MGEAGSWGVSEARGGARAGLGPQQAATINTTKFGRSRATLCLALNISLSPHLSPLSPHPPCPRRPLIRLLAVILLVGVPVVPILVFLGEVSLGAQRGQREEAGAGTDRGQRGRLQPHGQWGQGQGQSLKLGQLMGLELLPDDGVQLRSGDLLSPLDGSQDLLLVLLGKVG